MNTRQFLVCTGFLVLSELAAMALFLACRYVFSSDPFQLYVNLIISAGGLLFGVIGSLGAYPAARIAGIRTNAQLLAMMVLFSWAAIMVYKGLPFLLDPDAGRIDGGGFLANFDAMIAHSTMEFGHSDRASDIGRGGGYLLLMLDFAWAAGGAYAWFWSLSKIPHCEACHVYFRKRGKNGLTFACGEDAIDMLTALPPTPAARADALMAMRAGKHRTGAGTVHIDLIRRECPECREQSMTEEVSVHNGKSFVAQESNTYFWSPTAATRIAPAAEPEAVAPPAPAVAGFGRKGL